MKRVLVAVALVSVGAAGLRAQAKPGPELQRLQPFVGTWNFVGELKPGLAGPGGKITGTNRVAWMPGGLQLERVYEGKGPTGDMKGTEILGYDPARKVYTYTYSDPSGGKGSGTTTVSGNAWTSIGTSEMAGLKFQQRCTLTFGNANTTLTVKCEISADGKAWMPTIEGVGTKAK